MKHKKFNISTESDFVDALLIGTLNLDNLDQEYEKNELCF